MKFKQTISFSNPNLIDDVCVLTLHEMQRNMNSLINSGYKVGYVQLETNEICCLMKTMAGCIYKVLFELIEE